MLAAPNSSIVRAFPAGPERREARSLTCETLPVTLGGHLMRSDAPGGWRRNSSTGIGGTKMGAPREMTELCSHCPASSIAGR